MINAVKLDKDLLPKFDPVFLSKHRYLLLKGGAGSGKSFSASQKTILRCMKTPGFRHLVVRKVARTLKQSVFQRIKSQLASWNQSANVRINKSDLHIEFKKNRSEIIFIGLDDVEKVKSIDRIDSMWVEEATELTENDVDMLDLRMRGDAKSYYQMLMTFNPVSAKHHLRKRCDAKDPETYVHSSTYKDNPFVGEQFERVLMKLAKRNPELAKVYVRGEWGVFKGLIFKLMDYSPWPDERSFDEVIYCMDFGFTNPTALLRVGIKDEINLFVRELLYQTELTNSQRIKALEDLRVSKTAPIYADSAEPASIAEISKAGYNILPAYKGGDSVRAGISLLQSSFIHTLPSNTNFNEEMEAYEWAVDKNGEQLEVPKKKFDHCVDALRMGVFTHLGPPQYNEEYDVYDSEEEFGHLVPEMGIGR